MNVLGVFWTSPTDTKRYLIGRLYRSDCYYFEYCDTAEAERSGFTLLPAFPHLGKYRSNYLFPTFAGRIPSEKRTDRSEILNACGVQDHDNEWEILVKSQSATDLLTLEYE